MIFPLEESKDLGKKKERVGVVEKRNLEKKNTRVEEKKGKQD